MLAERQLVNSRSQAESYIKLGVVYVNGKLQTKAGTYIKIDDDIAIKLQEQYVSRAGLKLASVSKALNLDFKDKVVLDVGSSTGGFTDYALKHGAKKVIAVEVGTNQLHPNLHGNPKIELHEQTDIRDYAKEKSAHVLKIDIVVIDVSFISLREILPAVNNIVGKRTQIVAMFKPQFEADESYKHKGVIKNNKIKREIIKSFEDWAKRYFVIINKADSEVAGSKGNQERFYLLKKL